MAKTTQDLVTRVLQKLTQLEPGEAPNAEDDAFLTDTWATINANLRVRKVSNWPDDSIPDHVFEPLAEYVKQFVWQEYKGDRQDNDAIVERALIPVRQAVAMAYTGSAASTEYF